MKFPFEFVKNKSSMYVPDLVSPVINFVGNCAVVATLGTALPQSFMRTLLVVVGPEAVKLDLLGWLVLRRWVGHGPLKRAVHAFMTAILLRLPWFNAFWQDTEPYPPDGEVR